MANIGLLGMLAGAVLPVGIGFDRTGVGAALLEAAAGILFVGLMVRTVGGAAGK